MNILLATSEAVPFAKTGGLADVVGALPQALRRMVPPIGGQLLFPPAPYTFFMTLTCLNPDAFNRVMRPPSD